MPTWKAGAPTPYRLSLRWKLLLVLGLLLGVVHSFLGYLGYRNLIEQSERQTGSDLATYQAVLEALLEQSVHEQERLAAQIGTAVDAEQLHGAQPSEALAVDLLADLTAVEYFDSAGAALAVWNWSELIAESGPAAAPTTALQLARERALRVVAREHRPQAFLYCAQQCAQQVFVPAFDRAGKEVIVGVGRTLASTLLAFKQLTGADVALLIRPGTAGAGSDAGASFWGRRLMAVTDAGELLPLLQAYGQRSRPPGPDQQLPLPGADGQLMLALKPLPVSVVDGRAEALYI